MQCSLPRSTLGPMEVEILFFARLRELAGTKSTTLQVASRATVSEALETIASTYPDLREYLSRCRTALNEEFATLDAIIPENGVLAIIPPVSGG